MNKLIQDWLDSEKELSNARLRMDEALEKAEEEVELPANIRRAIASDIKQGAIIWYPRWKEEDGRCWNIVEEVLRASDDWKAYCAQDGCRYGLDGAFIEVVD